MTTNTVLTEAIEALVELVDQSDSPTNAHDVIVALLHRARGGTVSATVVLDGWIQLESEAGAVIESLTGIEQDGQGWTAMLHDMLRLSNDLAENAND